MKIELLGCESGDWEVVRVDGEIMCSTHRVRFLDWERIFKKLGIDAVFDELTDEEMIELTQ